MTCFSSERDDLNQWAKYQKASPGRYALGFYSSGLNREPNSQVYRVVYDRKKQEHAARRIVEATISFYLRGMSGDRLTNKGIWAREFFLAWDEWIYKLAPLAKTMTWHSEHEYRIVHELKAAEFPEVRFSQKKTMLSRYIALDFPCWVKERVSRLPIAAILIGPGNHPSFTKVSARLLLDQMGYANVPVEVTECTLTDP